MANKFEPVELEARSFTQRCHAPAAAQEPSEGATSVKGAARSHVDPMASSSSARKAGKEPLGVRRSFSPGAGNYAPDRVKGAQLCFNWASYTGRGVAELLIDPSRFGSILPRQSSSTSGNSLAAVICITVRRGPNMEGFELEEQFPLWPVQGKSEQEVRH